jgi:hypothetical protein
MPTTEPLIPLHDAEAAVRDLTQQVDTLREANTVGPIAPIEVVRQRGAEGRLRWATIARDALREVESLQTTLAGSLQEGIEQGEREAHLEMERDQLSQLLAATRKRAEDLTAVRDSVHRECRMLRQQLADAALSDADQQALALGRREMERRARATALRRAQARKDALLTAVDAGEDLPAWARTAIRREVGVFSTSVPVTVVESGKPRLTGEAGYHATPAGEVVRHPGAYERAGGRCHYVSSTEQVTVGRGWLRQHAGRLAAE